MSLEIKLLQPGFQPCVVFLLGTELFFKKLTQIDILGNLPGLLFELLWKFIYVNRAVQLIHFVVGFILFLLTLHLVKRVLQDFAYQLVHQQMAYQLVTVLVLFLDSYILLKLLLPLSDGVFGLLEAFEAVEFLFLDDEVCVPLFPVLLEGRKVIIQPMLQFQTSVDLLEEKLVDPFKQVLLGLEARLQRIYILFDYLVIQQSETHHLRKRPALIAYLLALESHLTVSVLNLLYPSCEQILRKGFLLNRLEQLVILVFSFGDRLLLPFEVDLQGGELVFNIQKFAEQVLLFFVLVFGSAGLNDLELAGGVGVLPEPVLSGELEWRESLHFGQRGNPRWTIAQRHVNNRLNKYEYNRTSRPLMV